MVVKFLGAVAKIGPKDRFYYFLPLFTTFYYYFNDILLPDILTLNIKKHCLLGAQIAQQRQRVLQQW